MTAPYTRAQLEAMPDRELDVAVAEAVIGFIRRYSVGFLYSIVYLIPPDYPPDKLPAGMAESCPFDNGHQFSLDLVPEYSTTWEGFGLVVERMQKKGFVRKTSIDDRGWGAVCFWDQNEGHCDIRPKLPEVKATAVAAVLASQGVAYAL